MFGMTTTPTPAVVDHDVQAILDLLGQIADPELAKKRLEELQSASAELRQAIADYATEQGKFQVVREQHLKQMQAERADHEQNLQAASDEMLAKEKQLNDVVLARSQELDKRCNALEAREKEIDEREASLDRRIKQLKALINT